MLGIWLRLLEIKSGKLKKPKYRDEAAKCLAEAAGYQDMGLGDVKEDPHFVSKRQIPPTF
jgi:hypothetical protein